MTLIVKAALDALMKGRTVISIAHRLSNFKNSDKILCIRGGVVVEVTYG